jgi:hypothetical protein
MYMYYLTYVSRIYYNEFQKFLGDLIHFNQMNGSSIKSFVIIQFFSLSMFVILVKNNIVS